MKIVQALEDSNILLKRITQTIKNETKEQKGGFLSMFCGTLGATLLGNMLAGKRMLRPGWTTTLIITNEEINDTMKIVQALEDSNILLKRITQTIKNETKEQKGKVLSMFLGTLGATLLGNMLAGKRMLRAGCRNKEGKNNVKELIMETKWIFNVASFFNKLWNTKVLPK